MTDALPADPKPHARAVLRRLKRLYPAVECALHHRNPFELVVATVLSAQCTDARVNQVTPALFARYPDAHALAIAVPDDLEAIVRPTGFFRSKAKNLIGLAQGLVERHGGAVPEDLDALTALPGVGRKTAHVVRGVAFGKAAGVVVDTHVKRLAFRLGLTRETDPVRVERDLVAAFPRTEWIDLSHRLIAHGRTVCAARGPKCERCGLADVCPRLGVKSRPADR